MARTWDAQRAQGTNASTKAHCNYNEGMVELDKENMQETLPHSSRPLQTSLLRSQSEPEQRVGGDEPHGNGNTKLEKHIRRAESILQTLLC